MVAEAKGLPERWRWEYSTLWPYSSPLQELISLEAAKQVAT
jgi:hypothetical protein